MDNGQIKPIVDRILPAMVTLRRYLHAHPEPGFKEYGTMEKILAHLDTIPGLAIRKEVAGTGIVATLGEEKKGPCVALRAEMDALPIEEATGLAWQSKTKGYMHACGHDGHVACLVGAALVLGELSPELKGPVKFIFQPAEEFEGGALRMCEAGALENPDVAAIFGLHSFSGRGTAFGAVAVSGGPVMAGSGNFRIVIHGKGGHAAYPHTCIDPVHAGMQTGVALQSIVSRSTNPSETVVVTVSSFNGGNSTNSIPGKATLTGTFRSLSPSLLEKTAKKIKAIAESSASTFGASAEVSIEMGYPVLVNSHRAAALLRSVAEGALGDKRVRHDLPPLMGCEDFAYYTQRVPGAFWFLGIRPEGEKNWPHSHNCCFDFNDDALAYGITLHARTALDFADLWVTKARPSP